MTGPSNEPPIWYSQSQNSHCLLLLPFRRDYLNYQVNDLISFVIITLRMGSCRVCKTETIDQLIQQISDVAIVSFYSVFRFSFFVLILKTKNEIQNPFSFFVLTLKTKNEIQNPFIGFSFFVLI